MIVYLIKRHNSIIIYLPTDSNFELLEDLRSDMYLLNDPLSATWGFYEQMNDKVWRKGTYFIPERFIMKQKLEIVDAQVALIKATLKAIYPTIMIQEI